jgi:transcriptional regulator with XRE-family HTH domain
MGVSLTDASIDKAPRKLPPRGRKVNGESVRDLRDSHAWNQAELARRTHLSRATVSRAEAGQQVSYAAIRQLAKILQVKASTLYAEDGEEEEDDPGERCAA